MDPPKLSPPLRAFAATVRGRALTLALYTCCFASHIIYQVPGSLVYERSDNLVYTADYNMEAHFELGETGDQHRPIENI